MLLHTIYKLQANEKIFLLLTLGLPIANIGRKKAANRLRLPVFAAFSEKCVFCSVFLMCCHVEHVEHVEYRSNESKEAPPLREGVELSQVLAGVDNMAQLMADSDLAIGAAGTTAWERCCLGLPALMLVLADNQRKVAQSLASTGAAAVLQGGGALAPQLAAWLGRLQEFPGALAAMSLAAMQAVDGDGAQRIAHLLEH